MRKNNLGDVKHFIDHDSRIMYMERHDNLTKDAVYAEWEAMQHFEGFNPSYETIVDYSNVPRVELDVSDLKELNQEMPNYDVRTNNVAIVAGLLTGRHLLASFFCTLTNLVGSRKYQVFHNKSEAEIWIYSQRKHK